MSKLSPSSPWRLARSAQTATIVPGGKMTSRCSTCSRQIRAVNGVTGSNRSTSSTARGTRPGSSASSAHWSGCSAKRRIACASWPAVVSMPPASRFTTSCTHSAADSLPPASPSVFAGRQQFADQVVAGSGPPGLEQTGHVLLGFGDGPLDVIPAGLERPDVELPLHPGGPGVQPPGILVRRAEHGRDRQRRVEPGHCGHEVATAVGGDPGPQVLQEAAHHRAPAIGRARRERRAHQRPQPPVLLPGEVQDVGVDVLGQRAAGHAEELGDLAAGKRGLP